MQFLTKTPIRLDHSMLSLLDQLFERPASGSAQCAPDASCCPETATRPSVEYPLAFDLSEQGDDIIVRASLPGFNKEAVKISVEDGVLAIKAERKAESEDTGERFIHRERRFASLTRRIELPSPVNEASATADLKDGVLTIRLPKSQEARAKPISIQ